VGADRTLRLALTEYQVVPAKVEVSAGALTIIVHNVGKLTHNLVITTASNEKVDGTPPIWPGATRQLSVTLVPGKYTLASTLFSDQALGQFGTLTVTS
jgi:plastocyanin